MLETRFRRRRRHRRHRRHCRNQKSRGGNFPRRLYWRQPAATAVIICIL